jgi:hypothetical protein
VQNAAGAVIKAIRPNASAIPSALVDIAGLNAEFAELRKLRPTGPQAVKIRDTTLTGGLTIENVQGLAKPNRRKKMGSDSKKN